MHCKSFIFSLFAACLLSFSVQARVCFLANPDGTNCGDGAFRSTPCTPKADETNCTYGTTTCSDGCSGTRTCCKSKPGCTPLEDEANCANGTQECDDGCGGTRLCCKAAQPSNPTKKCTPKADEVNCAYGNHSCDDGCDGVRLCCNACTPLESDVASTCAYGVTTCSDGCDGTRICCQDKPQEKYYTACVDEYSDSGSGVGDWHTDRTCFTPDVKDQDGNVVEAALDLNYKWCSGCWAVEQYGDRTGRWSASYQDTGLYSTTKEPGCYWETYDNGIDEKFAGWIDYSFIINGKTYTFTGEPKCQKIEL
jgi:hypothetical protein